MIRLPEEQRIWQAAVKVPWQKLSSFEQSEERSSPPATINPQCVVKASASRYILCTMYYTMYILCADQIFCAGQFTRQGQADCARARAKLHVFPRPRNLVIIVKHDTQ